MNLHDLGPDILLDFLNERYPGYTFDRLGPRLIHFHYMNEAEWHIISEDNYPNYEQSAREWAALRHIS
jgi:hypothetical protein